jgi:methylated-DNA-[protein]-cysteine S-methyltransferase
MPHLTLHTPLGGLTIFEEAGNVVALEWGVAAGEAETPLLGAARAQLHDYFDGRRTSFDLPLAPAGTAFQQSVWNALRHIPAGETRSYAAIGAAIGCRAARAIGQANAANPIPILIPCHRVVAADGSLGGYSGGEGPATKRYLLQLERRAIASRSEGSLA